MVSPSGESAKGEGFRRHNNTKKYSSLYPTKERRFGLPDMDTSATKMKETLSIIPQFDGPRDGRPELTSAFFRNQPERQSERQPLPHIAATAQHNAAPSVATDLLPFCVTGMQLNSEEVIGLSDIAGSLKEVVLLALGASVDSDTRSTIEKAVGSDAAERVILFWGEEWVAE
ncbi:hypothetical protein BCR34DRAFT_590818 [Clohesyomyces aquaticus]|uniref:Uncharacterized protein n=1 Tax=Clohesyomyces aquaticus TaxID=1231657 RepID=A0A1Y1Z5V8_9PLEO|nr:hypothetical protein BCR34DRAFT_590818 [Clohesyomyces aquaticus]